LNKSDRISRIYLARCPRPEEVAQDLYFFLGNWPELRDVAARVLPAWPPSDPAWGFVQGIWAFGLEENGDCRAAEAAAQNSLARNPKDVWGYTRWRTSSRW
jgi:hypothetical protein